MSLPSLLEIVFHRCLIFLVCVFSLLILYTTDLYSRADMMEPVVDAVFVSSLNSGTESLQVSFTSVACLISMIRIFVFNIAPKHLPILMWM